MNQIRVYVDNVFAAIPDTPEAREMKQHSGKHGGRLPGAAGTGEK